MIRKKEACPWHRCSIGYKYHHTGEEWDTHQQYAKTDIPRPPKSYVEYEDDKYMMQSNTAYYPAFTPEPNISKSQKIWITISLVSLTVLWGSILWMWIR